MKPIDKGNKINIYKKKDIIEKVIKEVVNPKYLDENTKYYINPTGRFVIRRSSK